MFEAKLKKSAEKFLKSLQDKELKIRIVEKIEKLKSEPFPHECVRIEGLTEKVFRVRVGDYRILYIVDHISLTIYVLDVDKRGRVYK